MITVGIGGRSQRSAGVHCPRSVKSYDSGRSLVLILRRRRSAERLPMTRPARAASRFVMIPIRTTTTIPDPAIKSSPRINAPPSCRRPFTTHMNSERVLRGRLPGELRQLGERPLQLLPKVATGLLEPTRRGP